MKKLQYYLLTILVMVAARPLRAQESATKQVETEMKATETDRSMPDISLTELKQAMADKAIVLLDCNGSKSYADSHIPGAIDFEAAGADLAKQLPQDKTVLIVSYCGGPKCLAYKTGADAATKLGYTNVKHFSKGISGWNATDGASDAPAQRLDYRAASPAALEAMSAFTKYARNSGLEPELITLVFMRSSQINGCAFCLSMHTKDAKAAGEDEQRLMLLPVWREAPLYSEREKAALAWTEAVTLIANAHVSDEVYESARKQFTEKELVDLTTAIIAINGWNRLNIAFKTPVVCDIE